MHVLKQLLKFIFLEEEITDLISVKLPNFKVLIGTIIAFYGKKQRSPVEHTALTNIE